MTRLNGIIAVLSDGARRAKYDVSILNAPVSRANRRFLSGLGLAMLFILVTLAVWPHRQALPKPITTPLPQAKAAPKPKKPSYRQAPAARRPILSLAPARHIPAHHIMEPPAPSEPPVPAAIQTVTAQMPLTEPALPPRLAGRWLFVASSSTKYNGYPPEYIELRLIEDAGVLHGRYQARYRINDRAISPHVAFRFDGRSGSDTVMLPWDGPGGAKGDVTLRLLPTGNLEIDWVAHQLGQELGLISGTATLVRKIE
jgi:hypothetical protein